MHLIHPISQRECKPLTGMYVCAVLQDGERRYGILSRTASGKLYLNDNASAGETPSKKGAQGQSKPASKKKIAAIKAKKPAKPSTKALTQQTLQALQALQEQAGEEEAFDGDYPYPRIPEPESAYSPYGDRTVLNLSSIAYLFPLPV